MVKFSLCLLLLVFLKGCQTPDKKAEFKGVWIDKSILEYKSNHETESNEPLKKFRLVAFDKEQADSVLFFFENGQRRTYHPEYSYNSYFVHLDMDDEYFLTIDYKTDELVFSNLKDAEFQRFKKTSLSPEELKDPSFNLEAFKQTLK